MGLVIAVYGSRAGVGVTAIATSLAHELRARSSADVALADLDPRAVRTRRQPGERGNGGASASAESARVDIPGVDAELVHQTNGIWTLAMTRPRTPAVGDAKAVALTLDLMRERFPVSVAELEHQVNERTLAAFDAADRLLLVTEGAVPSIRGTQRVLRLCRRLNYPDEKLCVVVNRVGTPGALPVEDIAGALKREVYWRIADGNLTTTGLAERLLTV
jgi:pilus assembly protein CpaE